MRNLKIIARDKKVQIFEEDVQFTKLYKNHQEMEENEVYVNNIELLEIPAFKSINQKCKIDLFDIWDLDINVTSVYLIYKDECFKSKRKILKWDSSAYAKLRENKNGTKD